MKYRRMPKPFHETRSELITIRLKRSTRLALEIIADSGGITISDVCRLELERLTASVELPEEGIPE